MFQNLTFRSTCPLSNILDLVGDRWSLIIVRDIFIGRNTYSEFLKSPEKISTNILVDRIKKLREYGLLDYRKDPIDRKIKYYYLTDKGINLYPILSEMSIWTKNNLPSLPTHELAQEGFSNIAKHGLQVHNKNIMNDYTKKRETLFELTS
ncbi:helix-turn-helix transcriptional regulator [Flavobacteriaceae bacterium LSUCC0859]|nr:helix-turn-helix transcriptional regulator [Flavobacteriaceae bacterium LSUCC0859]